GERQAHGARGSTSDSAARHKPATRARKSLCWSTSVPGESSALRLEALLFGLTDFDEALRPLQLARVSVSLRGVTPGTHRLEHGAAPAGSTNILHGGPTRADYGFEIVDQVLGPALQPWSIGIEADREVHPAFSRPLFWSGGEIYLTIDLAVHAFALRDGRVVVDDDLRTRIDALDLPNEGESLGSIALRIPWISDDEGKFRNDVEVTNTLGEFQRLGGSDLLLHFFECPVGTGLCSEEDHGATGPADSLQRGIGIADDGIDSPFTPPAEVQRGYAIAQLACMVLAQEEVHVVELN